MASPSAEPVASDFDLTSVVIQPHYAVAGQARSPSQRRWLLPDVADPPGLRQGPPRVRFTGKKVKVRIPL